MKFYNRILSTLLAVLMLLGSFTVFSAVGVSAAEADEAIDFNTYTKTKVYNTPDEKLAAMELMFTRGSYELYVDKISGEVATRDTRTGDVLFSNPYDIAGSTGSQPVKQNLMSQIIVQYEDVTTGKGDPLYSFKDAAMRDQIKVLNIKNGVRVEYSIGQEVTRKLVPRLISNASFTRYIQNPLLAAVDRGTLSQFNYDQFMASYKFESLENKATPKLKEQLLKKYPICEQMDIWVYLDSDTEKNVNRSENLIKNYCDEYTFEQMDADHAETGYEEEEVKHPLFKMALEYSLTDKGVDVTLPCNGLRYDMASYTLNDISVLPFMGAGNSHNEGYNFFPDGSGELFDFDKLDIGNATYIKAQIYGADYAYHEINVATEKSQKAIRYPVYGTVSEEVLHTFSYERTKLDPVTGRLQTGVETLTPTISNTIVQYDEIEEYVASFDGGKMLPGGISTTTQKRGYLAIIKEGESLAKIETCHGGLTNDYNYIRNYFNPKPKDSYDVADSLSVSTSSKWTVVSDRKYTGNIVIAYQMLTDEKAASLVEEEDYTYYEASWFGMAEAYRDYLVESGTLTKLESVDLEDNIPLYMEVFGAVETQEQVATIPMDVMTPLTTFDNILTMYKELSAEGVKNINFKMTGFANGGLGRATVPASLKWEKNVGGASGFRALIDRANAINTIDGEHLGLYPDFDFAYVENNTLFDSTNLKKDAIKTIDNRYSSKRQYSSTSQAYVSFYQLAISPSRYSKFYTKLLKNYDDYGLKSLSVGSLGSALNSDFDEDEPFNREDSKNFTVQAFSDIRNAGYSLMTENANAYTWGYVDHILNVDLDSSRHIKASASVPFIGVVLHGYVQFAGSPFNEEGDTDYAMLRALENGASLYFILSYQNTSELKEFVDLSQYYSVRYDIWKQDVISSYNELNGLLKDVQDKVIIDHDFVIGKRVLDLDELEAELKEQLKDAADKEAAAQQAQITANVLKIANAWQTAEHAVESINEILNEMNELNSLIASNESAMTKKLPGLESEVNDALKLMRPSVDKNGNKIDALPAAQATKDLVVYLNTLYSVSSAVVKNQALKAKLYEEGMALLETVADSVNLINDSDLSSETKKNMISAIQAYHAEALATFEKNANKYLEKNIEFVTEGNEKYVVDRVIAALAVVKSDDIEENASLLEACKEAMFTAEDVLAAGILSEDDADDDVVDNTDEEDDRFISDNNQIVIVTYGDRDDKTHEKVAYKSFILNYNGYAVVVEYEGVMYTIPRGGYVVVYHD